MNIIEKLITKYRNLAKMHGSTRDRRECQIEVPACDFDRIVGSVENSQHHIKEGKYETKGTGYFETYPPTLGQFYNPDIITLIRES